MRRAVVPRQTSGGDCAFAFPFAIEIILERVKGNRTLVFSLAESPTLKRISSQAIKLSILLQILPTRIARKPNHAVRPSQPATQVYNSNVRLIEVTPTSPGCFSASVNGDILVISSRQPLLDACRRLLEAGADPNSWVVMRHAGSEVETLRGKIGILAKLAVEDRPSGGKPPRFVRHRPMPNRAEGSSPIARREIAGMVPGTRAAGT